MTRKSHKTSACISQYVGPFNPGNFQIDLLQYYCSTCTLGTPLCCLVCLGKWKACKKKSDESRRAARVRNTRLQNGSKSRICKQGETEGTLKTAGQENNRVRVTLTLKTAGQEKNSAMPIEKHIVIFVVVRAVA